MSNVLQRGGFLQAEGGDSAEDSLLRTLVSPKEGFSISQGFKKPPETSCRKVCSCRNGPCDLIRFFHPELRRFGVVKMQHPESTLQNRWVLGSCG